MKKICLIILLALSNFCFSQDPRIFVNYWYLTNVIDNGVNNLLPTNDMGISFDPDSLDFQSVPTKKIKLKPHLNNVVFLLNQD